MAKLDSLLGFTGSLGNLTAYRRKGSDVIIVQKKGGPTRKQLKTSPAYENNRKVTSEFGGRSVMASRIYRAMRPLNALGNISTMGKLGNIMIPVQKNDTTSEFGKRHVSLTSQPKLLEGFQLNDRHSLESVLRTSLSFSLSREQHAAHVIIPELVPRINFAVPTQHPWYSIVITLGIVPDLFWTEYGYKPSHDFYTQVVTKTASSPWKISSITQQGITLNVQMDEIPPDESYTLMLAIGVVFGNTGPDGNPRQLPKSGCAKVLLLE